MAEVRGMVEARRRVRLERRYTGDQIWKGRGKAGFLHCMLLGQEVLTVSIEMSHGRACLSKLQ